jgi:threonine/homoserine/homoserine lactone efflux protein
MFRDGFMVALLNPKTALFYVAFLPQFMDMHSNVVGQSILLGTLFVFIAICTDCVYVVLAGLAAPMLRRSSGAARFGSYATGGAFIALGLLTALGGTRAKA